MSFQRQLALTLPLCFVVLLGCQNNPNAPTAVNGKVTYKGAPVSGGKITFQPEKEGPLYARPLGADGTYSISDVPGGNYVVTIETESINPDRKQPTYGGGTGAPSAGGTMPAQNATSAGKYVKIPAKYADAKTSGLKATIGADKKAQDFALTD